ncbi:MAG: hypothetical protein LBE80_04815 [Deltaproteobacteria bacterium]|nr:hypothetical protein [Deltaproteobacteria bacterium]
MFTSAERKDAPNAHPSGIYANLPKLIGSNKPRLYLPGDFQIFLSPRLGQIAKIAKESKTKILNDPMRNFDLKISQNDLIIVKYD